MRYCEILFENEAVDALRAEVIKLAKQLPYHWKQENGTTVMLPPNFLNKLAQLTDPDELAERKAIYLADLAYIKANPKAVQPDLFKQRRLPRAKLATLQTLLPRVEKRFRNWLATDYDAAEITAIFKSPMQTGEILADYLHDELSLDVESNGMITFWTLQVDGINLRKIIGDLPVALYHFTSSRLVKSIREHGLEGDRPTVNYRQEDGVYLTSETSGPPVEGYMKRAVTMHGGHPVKLVIKCYLSELMADPDDADINSGQHQFMVGHVPPERIVKVS